ncbi:MAG TPA: NAD(P)H-binding protein [Solirubrobacteraceae bacterium]|nr:NAD(P)H-binding protein [Solirubrobacteraceae bacterium]
MTESTILVLGGTGKTGRRVVDRLQARDVPVRVGSRTAAPRFDWEDRSTWTPALAGVRAVYVSYYPDLAIPGAPEAIAEFTDHALARGVRRLVLLSGRGEAEAQRSEAALQASGADWTIVRCSWFNQNFSESFFLDPVLAGEVALPAGDMPEPFVDADDIADVAVAALTDDRHIGELYELTGPRMLTFADAVAEIGRASGRELTYETIPMDAFAAGLTEQGVPRDIVEFLQYLFGEVLDGRNAYVADGVQRAIGREPRDFADFAREAAAAGVFGHALALERSDLSGG